MQTPTRREKLKRLDRQASGWGYKARTGHFFETFVATCPDFLDGRYVMTLRFGLHKAHVNWVYFMSVAGW